MRRDVGENEDEGVAPFGDSGIMLCRGGVLGLRGAAMDCPSIVMLMSCDFMFDPRAALSSASISSAPALSPEEVADANSAAVLECGQYAESKIEMRLLAFALVAYLHAYQRITLQPYDLRKLRKPAESADGLR